MLCLCGFELYPRWVPLLILPPQYKKRPMTLDFSSNLLYQLDKPVNKSRSLWLPSGRSLLVYSKSKALKIKRKRSMKMLSELNYLRNTLLMIIYALGSAHKYFDV